MQPLSLAFLSVLALAPLCAGEIVDLVLTLDPATARTNTVNLGLSVPFVGSDNDDTVVSGRIFAQVDIEPSTGVISALTFTSAELSATPVELSASSFFGSYNLTSTTLGGTIETTAPPAFVSPNGQSPAQQHTFTINSGRLSGTSSVAPVEQNFDEVPISGQGLQGTSVTITAVANAESSPLQAGFDFFLTYPLALTQQVEIVDGISATVTAAGTLNATGRSLLRRAISDPYLEWVALNNLGNAPFNEFSASPLLPNGLLWALGYQANETPAILTPVTTLNRLQFALILPENGTVGTVLIESSNTLTGPWTLVPASELSGAQNPLPLGSTGEIRITPSDRETAFYRLRAEDPNSALPSPQ